MAKINEDQVRDALKQVEDPILGRNLNDLRAVKGIEIGRKSVDIKVELPVYRHPEQEELERRIVAAVQSLNGQDKVAVEFTTRVRAVGGQPGKGGVPGVANAIAVASGKGGVGKSTVAVNLALALAQDGASVGLLDADIYGPSIPMMLGTNARPSMAGQNRIIPLEAFGLKLMSVGFLVPSDKAVIWRGPLVAQLITQFLSEVDWGKLDYLIVDMPPGTGDAHLTLVQQIQIAGAVIATTPQDVAIADAVKGIKMFEEVKTPVLGIIENMSYFVCPGCGEQYDIFGTGGGERTASRFNVPLLGQIPIDMSIRQSGDIGHPVVASAPDSPAAQAFRSVARQAAITLAKEAVKRPHRPSITLNPVG